jgi:hypothetical protein
LDKQSVALYGLKSGIKDEIEEVIVFKGEENAKPVHSQSLMETTEKRLRNTSFSPSPIRQGKS